MPDTREEEIVGIISAENELSGFPGEVENDDQYDVSEIPQPLVSTGRRDRARPEKPPLDLAGQFVDEAYGTDPTAEHTSEQHGHDHSDDRENQGAQDDRTGKCQRQNDQRIKVKKEIFCDVFLKRKRYSQEKEQKKNEEKTLNIGT